MYLLLSSILQRPRQTHRCINFYDSSPNTLQLFTKFQPWDPAQSKTTIILSNFGYHSLPNLKCTPDHSHVSYLMYTPLHTDV